MKISTRDLNFLHRNIQRQVCIYRRTQPLRPVHPIQVKCNHLPAGMHTTVCSPGSQHWHGRPIANSPKCRLNFSLHAAPRGLPLIPAKIRAIIGQQRPIATHSARRLLLYQLEQHLLRSIAPPRLQLQHPRIPTGAVYVARRNVVKHFLG